MYMGDIYTASINLAGVPSVSIPCGFDRQGLPVGFQLIGSAFSEPKLINAARVYQQRTDYHLRRAHTGARGHGEHGEKNE
jgi:aspartyl-tRNA(Asn)/glutamyl-tRNA(Gln) amidotransferase subunit A